VGGTRAEFEGGDRQVEGESRRPAGTELCSTSGTGAGEIMSGISRHSSLFVFCMNSATVINMMPNASNNNKYRQLSPFNFLS